MAESTLAVANGELRASIGHYLGYGRGTDYSEPVWTQLQTNDLNDLMKMTISQVVVPPILPGESAAYTWSWITPYADITIGPALYVVDLPDDFAGFTSPLNISTPAVAQRWWNIPIMHPQYVERLIAAQPDRTGAPQVACEKIIKGTTLTEGSRSQLQVFPKTNDTYVFRAQYKYNADALTGSLPYPPGGAEHGELYRASALAAAEWFKDNERGVNYQNFMDRLQASVFVDRKRKATKIGLNLDRSDFPTMDPRELRKWFNTPVTLNGNPL